jgi:hypothetical protein
VTVWGDLDEQSLLQVTNLFETPGYSLLKAATGLPNTPWALARKHPDGSVEASASTTLASGLFWSVDRTDLGPRLIVGLSPGAVVRSRTEGCTLDDDYLRGFALLKTDKVRTPYAEVRWIRPGVIARWPRPDGDVTQRAWSGPEVWPAKPTAEGPEVRDRYLDLFDAAISDLIPREGPIAAFLSGGLDSSFVVAALALQTNADRPVHAFTHAPHPDAIPASLKNWDSDESRVALAMQEAYPDRVVVHRLVNEELVCPLDAALDVAQRTWVPTVNTDNQVWISQIEARAAQIGAQRIFVGDNGNAAFSHEPGYAASYYLSRGDVRGLASLIPTSRANDVSRAGALASRFLGPSLASLSRFRSSDPTYTDILGLPAPPRSHHAAGSGRREYLSWLASHDDSYLAWYSPDGRVVPMVDPFRAAGVMKIAATITPREWCTGPYPRGFARRLGQGRVPDVIRLRTRRGGQATDTWFSIRNHRDRYFDEARALDNTPVLGGWVDTSAVVRTLGTWPWGQIQGPPDGEVETVDFLLSLAGFIRMTQARLRTYPRPPSRKVGEP